MTSCFTRFLPRFRNADQDGQAPSTTSRSNFRFRRFRPSILSHNQDSRTLINSVLDAMTIDTEDAVPPRKKQKTKKPDDCLTCRICHSPVGDAYLKPCRRCKQPTCYNCIKGLFAAAMSDHERMPVRCCGHVTYHNVLKDLVPQAEVDRYAKRYDEASTSNPFYCPVPTCSAFIPPRVLKIQMQHGRITCESCKTTSCVGCKQVAESDHKCGPQDDGGLQDDRDIILKSFQYKICPKCGTGVMRMFGCAHVRCMCGSHWCWDCQRPINACYAKPCSRARDEGETSQAGETDVVESDSETEDARLSHEHHLQAAVDSVPLSNEIEDADATRPHIANPARLWIRPTAWRTSARTTGNEEPHADVSEEPTAPPRAETDDRPDSQPAEALVNLDDPDGNEDWEGGDLDFGNEPADEEWDIWGCLHHFNELDQDNISSKWLFDQSKAEDFELECMGCFRPMGKVKGKKQRELDRQNNKTEKDEIKEMMEPAETLASIRRRRRRDAMSGTSSLIPSDEGSMTDTSAKGKKPSKSPTNKKAAYDCRDCGVLFCWHCRKDALKKVKKWKRDAGEV